jgi:hypothetical protein
MNTTKFYIVEQEKQPILASKIQLYNPVRREISVKEALALDEAWGKEIAALDKEWPEIERKFLEDDLAVVELAKEVHALFLARSPRLLEKQKALNVFVSQKEGPKKNWEKKRRELFSQRERFVRPVCVDVGAVWQNRWNSLNADTTISEIEVKEHPFSKNELVVRSNRASLRRALDFLTGRKMKLLLMINGASLSEVLDFVKATEREFESFDVNEMGFEKMDEGEHRQVREAIADAQEDARAETVYFAGKDSVKVKTKGGDK